MTEPSREHVYKVSARGLGRVEPAEVDERSVPPLAYYDASRDVLYVNREHRNEVIRFLEAREREVAAALGGRGPGPGGRAKVPGQTPDEEGEGEGQGEGEGEGEGAGPDVDEEREGCLKALLEALRQWLRRLWAGTEDEEQREFLERLLELIRGWLGQLRDGSERDLADADPSEWPDEGDIRVMHPECVFIVRVWDCVEIEEATPPLYAKGRGRYGQCVGTRNTMCWERWSPVAEGELYEDPDCTQPFGIGELTFFDWECLQI